MKAALTFRVIKRYVSKTSSRYAPRLIARLLDASCWNVGASPIGGALDWAFTPPPSDIGAYIPRGLRPAQPQPPKPKAFRV